MGNELPKNAQASMGSPDLRVDDGNAEVMAFGADEDYLLGTRPSSIGLWRWIAFQQPCNRYTYWVLRAARGELPGVYRAAKTGKWMVAIDWKLIDEIGLIPAIKRMGWVTAPGQLPGQPPGSASSSEPKPET